MFFEVKHNNCQKCNNDTIFVSVSLNWLIILQNFLVYCCKILIKFRFALRTFPVCREMMTSILASSQCILINNLSLVFKEVQFLQANFYLKYILVVWKTPVLKHALSNEITDAKFDFKPSLIQNLICATLNPNIFWTIEALITYLDIELNIQLEQNIYFWTFWPMNKCWIWLCVYLCFFNILYIFPWYLLQ